MISYPSSSSNRSTTNMSSKNCPTMRTHHQLSQHTSHSSNTFQVNCRKKRKSELALVPFVTLDEPPLLILGIVYLTKVFATVICLLDLTGKNIIRPGNYIRELLEAPEKNYQPIHDFSSSTLRDAFNLRVGSVPGVSNN